MDFKRKLDSLVDNMEVIIPGPFHRFDFFGSKGLDERSPKRLKISVNARVEPYEENTMVMEDESHHQRYHSRSNYLSMMEPSIETEDEDDNEDREIPTTSEVIASLRKVMLWMSKQGDYNSDHIQYLTNVERYALSKCDDSYGQQQRKITQYFLKHND